MACNKQAGVAVYLDFLEKQTGVKATQQDWHNLKQLAAEEGFDVSRARVSKEEAESRLIQVGSAQVKREGTASPERLKEFDEALDVIPNVNVTRGTVAVMDYITKYGYREALASVRGETSRMDNNDDYGDNQAEADLADEDAKMAARMGLDN